MSQFPQRSPAPDDLQGWQPIIRAPWERDLELAVIGTDGIHALTFPCRRTFDGWLDARTKKWVDVRPTHWREWAAGSRSVAAPLDV